jgi:HK97 gp10 family phage protein
MPAIIAGMAKLQAQLQEVGLAFTPQDLQPGAAIILAEAQQLCPVDTGFLRDSAFMQVSGDDVEIGFEADYASYVEFGTYKMAAQPYLRPAFDNVEEEALSAIVDSIEAHLRDITK